MKKFYLSIMVALGMMTSCYDDKGKNDFDSPMDDVEMIIPETAYSGSLGETIHIEPIVKTAIPESDLEFMWEAKGDLYNDQGRATFSPLVDTDSQAKDLDYICRLDDNITKLNTSYTCRLHARQKSTGRDFYSSNTFTITIAGVTGLMVLYDDGSQSDLGVLMADEFMPAANSIPEKASAVSAMYSNNNGGDKMSGKAVSVVNMVPDYYYGSTDNFDLVARTTGGYSFLSNTSFTKKGDWSYMFYLSGDRAVNHNKPDGFIVNSNSSYFIAFDDGEMYVCSNNEYPFLFAEITPSKPCGDGNYIALEPHLLFIWGYGGVQYMGYSREVNGAKQKGFIAYSQIYQGYSADYASTMNTGNDVVPFNPSDMKADLVRMNVDATYHVMAVMKGDSDHPKYPGKNFLVELYPNADASGESGLAGVPLYMHDMSGFTDIDKAFAFDFGSTKNMCYYATPSGVYHYGHDDATLYSPTALEMTDGSALTLDGEVTMMKILASPNITTHYSDAVLMVATWKDGASTLYALHLDESTGKVSKAVKYDKTTVEGWDFGIIRDANIKSI